MTMFYGNFDSATRASSVSLPGELTGDSGRALMAAKPLYRAFAEEGEFFLVTYAVPVRDGKPDSFSCHACAPILGVAVFTRKPTGWILTQSNRTVTNAGVYGKPPSKVKLIRIGPNHHAVQVEDTDDGGQRTTVLLVLVPWHDTVTLALERIMADDDKGMCDPKGLPCYSNHRSLKMLSSPASNYYDLELSLTGTDLPASENPRVWAARKVAGVEVLRFNSGTYEQLSRSGDLTTVDRVVARREHRP